MAVTGNVVFELMTVFLQRVDERFEPVDLDFQCQLHQFTEFARGKAPVDKPEQVFFRQPDQRSALVFAEWHLLIGDFYKVLLVEHCTSACLLLKNRLYNSAFEFQVVFMPKASELKRGDVVQIDGAPHVVKQLDAKSPSARGAATLYKIRFDNLVTGQKRDESLKGDDFLGEADCEKVQVQFSYIDGDHYVFMNTEDYSQYQLSQSALADQLDYLTDGLEGITALLVEGNMVAADLPQSVVLEIAETAPAIKGASASARTKPATLSTGLIVQVPEYIEQGEHIKVNTTNAKFMSRA